METNKIIKVSLTSLLIGTMAFVILAVLTLTTGIVGFFVTLIAYIVIAKSKLLNRQVAGGSLIVLGIICTLVFSFQVVKPSDDLAPGESRQARDPIVHEAKQSKLHNGKAEVYFYATNDKPATVAHVEDYWIDNGVLYYIPYQGTQAVTTTRQYTITPGWFNGNN